MKKLFLILILGLFASAFAQYKFTVGVFHKSFTFANSNSYQLIGTLPPNAYVNDIYAYNISTIPYIGNTNTLLSIGIVSSTNYFLTAFQVSNYASQVTVANILNAGKIFSTTTGTPIYAYFTNVGVTASSNFSIRVAVRYVQN